MRTITLATAAAVALSLTACTPTIETSNTAADSTTAAETASGTQTHQADTTDTTSAGLTLEGTATGAANVSYGASGSISTSDIRDTGSWSQTITDAESTDIYLVTVMDSTGADDAEVSCKIIADGEVEAEETATGGYAAVTCTQPIF